MQHDTLIPLDTCTKCSATTTTTVVVLCSYIKVAYLDLGDVNTHRFRIAVVVIAVWGKVADSERS